MNYLADAHRDWHTVNGAVGTIICPLDCYDPPCEPDYCGFCDGPHAVEDCRALAVTVNRFEDA